MFELGLIAEKLVNYLGLKADHLELDVATSWLVVGVQVNADG